MQQISLALLVTSLLAVSNASSAGAQSTATAPAKPAAQNAKPVKSPVPGFVAIRPDTNFPLPKIVLQFDPATETGYDWDKLKDLNFYQLSGSNSTVAHTIHYLREAVQRMTGKELP